MRVSKVGKLIVKNYSNVISNEEINECMKVLSIEYKKVKAKVFIHKNFKGYFYFCVKNVRLLDLLGAVEERGIEKIRKNNITEGLYKRNKNEIHIFEERIRESLILKKKAFKELEDWKYVDETLWKKYEDMWTKYKIIYDLIHEMTHAIQFSKNKFTVTFKDILKKWDDKKYEIDAVTRSEAIYKKLDKDFIKILKVDGIHVYHQYEDELYVGFKYNITYKSIN
ncbi:hypothetical protein HBE96_00410 [Clostridium sp. P21]|uniref:Uncharacterized protein n=1 Tax=Clostridium muellerianum TaxID=2716538 RepID=A0A7Y0ECW6_9CLOT|nr:hypothetical protein [Clostridium muellerianum]NMM61189.1 hypothetical protein [Clostridium muellerianum]